MGLSPGEDRKRRSGAPAAGEAFGPECIGLTGNNDLSLFRSRRTRGVVGYWRGSFRPFVVGIRGRIFIYHLTLDGLRFRPVFSSAGIGRHQTQFGAVKSEMSPAAGWQI